MHPKIFVPDYKAHNNEVPTEYGRDLQLLRQPEQRLPGEGRVQDLRQELQQVAHAQGGRGDVQLGQAGLGPVLLSTVS